MHNLNICFILDFFFILHLASKTNRQLYIHHTLMVSLDIILLKKHVEAQGSTVHRWHTMLQGKHYNYLGQSSLVKGFWNLSFIIKKRFPDYSLTEISFTEKRAIYLQKKSNKALLVEAWTFRGEKAEYPRENGVAILSRNIFCIQLNVTAGYGQIMSLESYKQQNIPGQKGPKRIKPYINYTKLWERPFVVIQSRHKLPIPIGKFLKFHTQLGHGDLQLWISLTSDENSVL